MPGRGQPWKEGGHVDDTILGEDIKDGTITEVDLDSALQSKVNSGGHTIQDEGTPITNQSNLNFIGTGVTAVFGGEDTTTVTIPGGTGHIIEDEGTPLIDRPDLNFVGAGVTVTDDGEGAKTIVTIPSGADGVGYDTVQDEGSPLTQRGTVDFKGTGVTVTDDGETSKTIVTIPSGADGVGYDEIENTGTPLTKRPTINFTGAGVTAIDDGENSKTIVDIPGGAGASYPPDLNNDFVFYDEFFYPAGLTGLQVHYEPTANSVAVPTDTVGGQVDIETSGVANNVAKINTCGAGLASFDPTKALSIVWRINKGFSDADSAYIIGAFRNLGSFPGGTFPFSSLGSSVFAVFRSDGTGNWFAQLNDGGGLQTTDTGVTTDTAQHVFEIIGDPLVPNIIFKIDGATVATYTTNLPTSNMAVYAGVMTNTGIKRLDIDSLIISNER